GSMHRFLLSVFLLGAVPGLVAAGVTFDARSARTGNWSDPATWEKGRVPHAGDFVQIRPGDVVTYDANSDQPIRMLHVAGTLTFSRQKDTRLDVGLLKIQPGTEVTEDGAVCDYHPTGDTDVPPAALEIGTPGNPIPPGVTAMIKLVYFPGANKDAEPAIIDCGGRWDVHGAPLAHTWLKLATPAKAGDGVLTVVQPVNDWRPGDHVIITTSQPLGYVGRPKRISEKPDFFGTEDRSIIRVEGSAIYLDRPLTKSHAADDDTRAEVANLSRNVVIESANPNGVRGHTMFHHHSTGSISYAEFRHLGKEGLLGRYPIHFHLVRDSMRGSSVIGASIWDSANRFVAIHGTDYLLVRDCVGYQCMGHGYFLEDATEQYNILDHNLAVGAYRANRLPKQALGFDANEGAGFWWANGRNTLIRNVACENYQYGFRFQMEGSSRGHDAFRSLRMPDGSYKETDVRTVPFFRFEDNEAHCNGLYDFDFGDDPDASVHGDESHPFIVRGLRSWRTNYALRPNVAYMLGEDLFFYDNVYGVYHPTYNQQVFRNVHVKRVSSEPINRGHDDESFQNGSFTYDGLSLEDCRTGRDPIIQLSCTSDKPGQSGHFRNLKVVNCKSPTNVIDLGGGPRNDKLENGVIYYFHDWPAPGQVMEVASLKFPKLMTNATYASIPNVTGPDVRAAQVSEVPFPELLHPIDDLPPATIVTSVRRAGDKLLVGGVTHDNTAVASVNVNGHAATIVGQRAGVADWEITLDAGVTEIVARGIDSAGNAEQLAARIVVARAAAEDQNAKGRE
ncbi:MAG TPA: G8 domain-containing protein, partial [Tepidisphaeraceae bacterium]|nr:G8 domain-containing protein [Tepidisphaeraceae bacterium]